MCVCECVERFFLSQLHVSLFVLARSLFLVTASCGGIMTLMTMNLIVLIL